MGLACIQIYLYQEENMKVKVIGLLILCLAVSCASSGSAPAPAADVVVVGSGLSGLSAALSAAENGAKVIVVEKLGIPGGSSALAGGGIGATGSAVQKRYGIEDSVAAWRATWVERQNQSLNKNSPYPDMARVDWLIPQGPAIIDWMISQGVVYDRPEGYGVDTAERLHFPRKPGAAENDKGNGASLIQYLLDSAEKKGVTILLETKAVELVVSGGAVCGVRVEDKNGTRTIAAKAVVLAAGGFGQSAELRQRFIPGFPFVTSVASPGNTGDGILMAEKVGAALYEEPWIIGLYTGVNERSALGYLPYTASLYVAPNGKRVMNEAQHYALITNSAIAAGGVLYSIYDSSDPQTAGLIAGSLGENAFTGSSLQALAAAAGIDPAGLAATITAYNGYAKAGKDADFGKAPALLKALTQGPFYAVKVVPNIMGTIGGVKTRVETGEVLDTSGAVIPGLYAAGENANRAFFNQVYMSGGALLIASATGKASGAAAAAYSRQ
jgi:fumarate reductase flavoprotein subunit